MTTEVVDLSKVWNHMITIIVDASYNDRAKTLGWAAWCVSNKERRQYAGASIGAQNSTEAEFYGIVQALHAALQYFHPVAGTRILVQCDNLGALNWLLKAVQTGTGPGQWVHDSVRDVYQLGREYPGMRWEIRHVKGHQNPKKDARTYCNVWADKEAAKQRREFETRRFSKRH